MQWYDLSSMHDWKPCKISITPSYRVCQHVMPSGARSPFVMPTTSYVTWMSSCWSPMKNSNVCVGWFWKVSGFHKQSMAAWLLTWSWWMNWWCGWTEMELKHPLHLQRQTTYIKLCWGTESENRREWGNLNQGCYVLWFLLFFRPCSIGFSE